MIHLNLLPIKKKEIWDMEIFKKKENLCLKYKLLSLSKEAHIFIGNELE